MRRERERERGSSHHRRHLVSKKEAQSTLAGKMRRRRRHTIETYLLFDREEDRSTMPPPETPPLRVKEKDGVVANIIIEQQRRLNVLRGGGFGSQRCDAKLRFCDELRRRYPKARQTPKAFSNRRQTVHATGLRQRALLLLLQKKGRHSLFLSALVVSSKMGLVVVLSKSSNL